ncbi:hypothetical protein [Pseudonocardia sp. GCM10023141]|uniref:hypothetical protein n=1 Tax=Pseudonocardia sp. GCM10023141 TaxID=3252653 RepID=UPI0036121A71
MTTTAIDTAGWQAVDLRLYGASLLLPPDWETLPPVPANGQEVLRATGGAGLQLIVFKLRSHGRSAVAYAAGTQTTLEKHGYTDFTIAGLPFAGVEGACMQFRYAGPDRPTRTSWEFFAPRGPAMFVLGLSSTDAERDRPTVDALAAGVTLTPGPSRTTLS